MPDGVGHRSQSQVNLDGGDGLLAELGDQLFEGAAQRIQVPLQRDALGVEAAAELLGAASDLGVYEDRRRLLVHQGDKGLERAVAQRQR